MKAILLFIAGIAITQLLAGCEREAHTVIPFKPDFVGWVQAGKITRVEVIQEPNGVVSIRGEIDGRALDVIPPDFKPVIRIKPGSTTKFKVSDIVFDDSLKTYLLQNHVEIRVKPQKSPLWQCIVDILPIQLYLIWIVGIAFIFWLAVRLVRAVEKIAKNTER